jgi:very-short-patch-repair endonuclease
MDAPTPRELAAGILPAAFLSSADLAQQGVKRHVAQRLVRDGRLLRLRRGRYTPADAVDGLVRAGELGGRLDCLSLLSTLGVFVHACSDLHVQIERGSTRLPVAPGGVVRHWRSSGQPPQALAADLIEALAQAFRCQGVREALCTLESAWHHGLIDADGVAAVFARLPRRYHRLRSLLDRRAESGPETIMRLLLRGLGCEVEVQVVIRGVGRVDLVVDGWLIVECDSKAYHEGWEKQKDDRRRDLAAATLGYTTVRLLAEDILYRRDAVLMAMKAVLAHASARSVLHNSARSGSCTTKRP